MANPEHLKILEKGAKVWNKWKIKYDNIVPDLSYADLSHADLNHADLSFTNLRHARLKNVQLQYADLMYAKLNHADLSDADLTLANLVQAHLDDIDLSNANLLDANLAAAELVNANLTNANLVGVNFRYANLSNANLRNANLFYATIYESKLSGTKFNGAQVGYTIFTGLDLREALGLETVNHGQPSEVGISTFYLSYGRIPEVFLRGCGVPEELIIYMHSLAAAGQSIQFYKSFISYSSKDQKFADRLYVDLQNMGVRCWLASEDLKIGDRIRVKIDDAIRLHDKLLLVLSRHSIASDWVEQEVETALARERKEKRTVLFPVRVDDAVMKVESGWPALIRNTRNIGDFRKWKNHDSYQKAFDKLLRDLKAEE